MVLRLMLINSVFWKPQFQGGVLKIGGDVRENSGPAEHVEFIPTYLLFANLLTTIPIRRQIMPIAYYINKDDLLTKEIGPVCPLCCKQHSSICCQIGRLKPRPCPFIQILSRFYPDFIQILSR